MYVEHDIQATDAISSVEDFVFSDPRCERGREEMERKGAYPLIRRARAPAPARGWVCVAA